MRSLVVRPAMAASASSLTTAWPRALSVLRQLYARIWPLSRKSAASWVVLVGILYGVWVKTFVHFGETTTIQQEKAKERKRLTELMKAVLLYAENERTKAEAERKMPEARRVYSLLWDETFTCKVTRYGLKPTDDRYVQTEALLTETLHDELRKCIELTRTARDLRLAPAAAVTVDVTVDGDDDDDASATMEMERLKAIAEHESGEKLKNMIIFVEQVRRNLGARFIDVPQLREARVLKKAVFREQSRNTKMLSTLVKPLLPNIFLVMALSAWRGIGRGVFHQIRYWSDSIEMASKGDVAGAGRMLLFVWAGHILLQVTEYLELTFSKNAESRLGQSVRNGVLESMVRQDYEYFDKNSAGILQERLNRDANELGNNMVMFPARNIQRVTFILSNLGVLFSDIPKPLLLPCFLPCIATTLAQIAMFKFFRKYQTRERRIEEDNVKVTAEVLREIKTVRQFAMESEETANYSRSGLGRHLMVQGPYNTREWLARWVWSVLEAGLVFCVWRGFPFLQSGEVSVTDMLDVFCKVNFGIVFTMKDLIMDLEMASVLLEPLGRICDLLDSSPQIEPDSDPAWLEFTTPAELTEALADCSTIVADASRGIKRTVTSRALAEKLQGDFSSHPRPAQATLVALKCEDFRYINVADKAVIEPLRLEYPVRGVFSKKLRPLRFKGKIEFRDVNFRYPTDLRKPVLQGISFVVEPGQKVALVGSTGCGKSSCMALLQRLYTPLSGEILIDDVPIEQYDIHYLRSRIVMVDQHTVLFNASIRDNIAYGTNATDDEIIQALKDAKIWEFVEKEPDQLLSILQEGGSNLSGGQRQRLAIARAMVRRPDVILLDEATSALDNESEALVQEALDALARKGSALVIAHRLSTIMDSDQIVVVGSAKDGPLQGTVVEQGTHDALLATTTQPLSSDGASVEKAVCPPGDNISSSEEEDDDDAEEEEEGDGDENEDALAKRANTNPYHATPYMSKEGAEEAAAGEDVGSITVPAVGAQEQGKAATGGGEHDAKGKKKKARKTHGTSYKRLWHAATGEDEEGMTDHKMAEKAKKLKADLERLEKKLERRRAKRAARLALASKED